MIHPKTKIENLPLLGRFDVPISSSGRFVLPEEWRFITVSSRDVYVMPDEDEGCLRLIPGALMEKELARGAELALCDPKLNQALKVIGEHTCIVTVDQDGGIEIPDWQRKYMGTQDHVALQGAVRMIKIYDPKMKPLHPCGGTKCPHPPPRHHQKSFTRTLAQRG